VSNEPSWLPPVLSAFVFPGAGQLKNGERLKGVLLGVATVLLLVALILVVLLDLGPLLDDPPDLAHLFPVVHRAVTRALLGHGVLLGLFGVVWVVSIVDAFVVARARNQALRPTRGGWDRPGGA
jgi:hypothetical protein